MMITDHNDNNSSFESMDRDVIGIQTQNNESLSNKKTNPKDEDFPLEVVIIAYVLIFCVSVVGNIAVIVTLTKVRSMRTVTNVLLINLSVADLLVSICCMPATLTGVIMQDFVFGSALCRIIPFLQGVAVCVSAFTLTVLSLERYFAVCRPLRSRKWQTLSHAYRCIFVAWLIASISMIPLTVVNRIIPFPNGRRKCFEAWGRKSRQRLLRRTYSIFLDLILLVIPLLVMSLTYSLVIRVLHKKSTDAFSTAQNQMPSGHAVRHDRIVFACKQHQRNALLIKRKTVTMLIAIMVEFFICHTPNIVLQTWVAFDREHAWSTITTKQASIIVLLTYISNGCNPITYCFLSQRFREAFAETFLGRQRSQRTMTEFMPSRGSYSVITFRRSMPRKATNPDEDTTDNGCVPAQKNDE